jgi:hypothetical protein
VRLYPYHRYLVYQVLNGDDVAEIVGHMADLEYIAPRIDDVQELAERFSRRMITREVRERQGVLFFDEDSDSRRQMSWIVETVVARTCAERLLLDGVQPREVATIIGFKFSQKFTKRAVEMFRDGFWNTAGLTAVDFEAYFALAGSHKPPPPPSSVSLATRAAYAAWKQGLPPGEEDLSPDAMVREIQVDAFMRFKEQQSRNDARSAMEWAKLALKTAPARRALATTNKGGDIPGLKPIVDYPEHNIPTLGELHSEYSQEQSGTGAVSEATGRREDDDDSQA